MDDPRLQVRWQPTDPPLPHAHAHARGLFLAPAGLCVGRNLWAGCWLLLPVGACGQVAGSYCLLGEAHRPSSSTGAAVMSPPPWLMRPAGRVLAEPGRRLCARLHQAAADGSIVRPARKVCGRCTHLLPRGAPCTPPCPPPRRAAPRCPPLRHPAPGLASTSPARVRTPWPQAEAALAVPRRPPAGRHGVGQRRPQLHRCAAGLPAVHVPGIAADSARWVGGSMTPLLGWLPAVHVPSIPADSSARWGQLGSLE